MMQLSSKYDDSSICYDVIGDVIYYIINQCEPRRPKGTSGVRFVFATRAALANEYNNPKSFMRMFTI